MMDMVRVFLIISLSLNILLFSFVFWQSKYTRLPPRCPDCEQTMQAEWYCFYCDDLTARML